MSVTVDKIIKTALTNGIDLVGVQNTVRSYLLNEINGAEKLYNILIKTLSSRRQGGHIKLRALDIINLIFLKSKEFRIIISKKLRELIRCCCNGFENNSRNILNNTLSTRLFTYIHHWDTRFGHVYPEVRTIARYYRESVPVLDENGVRIFIYVLYINTI